MPEINENKRKKGSDKKSACSSCTCCFFPSNSKKKRIDEEHTEHSTETLMVANKEADPPFVDDLPQIVEPGFDIRLHGYIKAECSRFSVNLKCGREPQSDIAAHFNPRLSQRYVVRNSKLGGRWGDEETTSIAKFDLARNKKFDLDIMATEKEFLVAINGRHICGFVFRIPLSKVKVIQVEGAVEVHDIKYRKLQIYPQPSPQNVPFSVPAGDGQDEVAIQQLEMPLTAVLPRGFERGWQLEIDGRVKILPYAFYINLQKGTQLWPHPIVPLHLNPRFSTIHGKRLFVRNAWLSGEWGAEECCTGFAFSPGSHFSIAIRKNDDNFSVWVDGQMQGEFRFRGDVENIDALYIHGDVVINRVYMKQQYDDKYFSNSYRQEFTGKCGTSPEPKSEEKCFK